MNIDDISITNYFDGSPLLLVNPETLDDFEYLEGFGPSNVQSFSFSGIDMLEDVSIDVTGEFEIAKEIAGPYGSGPYVFSPFGGDIAETIIYVRMAGGITEGGYNGIVGLYSGATVTETVTLSGSVVTALEIPYSNALRSAGDGNNALDAGFTISDFDFQTGGGGYLRLGSGEYIETPYIDFTQYNAIHVRFNATTYDAMQRMW